MHSLGTRLGSWGRTVGKPQAANPLVTESKGEGSINDPFKGEKCKFFFNSLSPFWKPPEHRYRLVYDAHWPLGQLDFWICQPFCKRVEMMKNIWCNESTPKLKKKTLTDSINQKLFTVIFPLLILWIFFIIGARTNCARRIRAVILVVMSLQILFLFCWRDCKCSTLVIACKSCSEVHCKTSKKRIEFSFSQDE